MFGRSWRTSAGRPEEHHRTRWDHTKLIGNIGLSLRSNQPLFEHGFLSLHAAHVIPESARKYSSLKFSEFVQFTSLHRHSPLEVAQRIVHLEPISRQRARGFILK